MRPAWGATWPLLGVSGCLFLAAVISPPKDLSSYSVTPTFTQAPVGGVPQKPVEVLHPRDRTREVCASAQNETSKEPEFLGPSGTELPRPNWLWKKRAATLVPSFTKTTTHRTTTTTHRPTTTHHPTTTQHRTTTHRPTTTHHPTTTQHRTTTAHRTTTHRPTTTHHPTTTQHRTTTAHHTATHHSTTTHHTTINHTTAPVNYTTVPHSTPPDTTVPVPTQLPIVPIGDYKVGNESAMCLRMQAGLQLQVRYRDKDKRQLWGAFAVQPNHTEAFGNCSSQAATLDLRFAEGSLFFTFLKNETANTFYLSRVQAILTYQFRQATGARQDDDEEEEDDVHYPEVVLPFSPLLLETTFGADNPFLREFEARLGHSYQCGNRSLALTQDFRLHALQERVQAFELKAGQFGEAEFCQEQRRPAILPIIVGVVLGLLIVIVVVAYAVGRWRTHRGYQTI